jgi:hypothetical protein
MFDSITNNWDYHVEMQPIYDGVGNEITTHRAAVRTDTNLVLGVHGSKYKIISNDDVVSSVMDAVDAADIGKDYKFTTYISDDGRKMRGEILFPNEVITPAIGDITQFRVSFYNSYDGSWAFQQSSDGLRLWCLNGCTTPATIAKTWAKHTTNVSVEGSSHKILQGLAIFRDQEDVYKNYITSKVTPDDVENFFRKTLCHVKTRSKQDKHNDKRLEELLKLYDVEADNLGQNKWALYNTMTYWATHTGQTKSPENTRRIRENEIAVAIENMRFL